MWSRMAGSSGKGDLRGTSGGYRTLHVEREGCAVKIVGGTVAAVIPRHGGRSRPLRAPALPANRLPLPSFGSRLALEPSWLVRAPGPAAAHPAVPLRPLRAHVQLPD